MAASDDTHLDSWFPTSPTTDGPDTAHPVAEASSAGDVSTAPPAPGDDDEYLYEPRRRSRTTTALLVALIFALGAFTGIQLAHALTPTPAPRIVFVLNPSSAAPTIGTPSTPGGPITTANPTATSGR